MGEAVSDLAAWLLECIAEDERVARIAGRYVMEWGATEFEVGGGPYRAVCESSDYGSDPLEHIARHDPARVLAECASKRRLVELHAGVDPCDGHDPITLASEPCDTLRLLALPYRDRPGWRDEWTIGH